MSDDPGNNGSNRLSLGLSPLSSDAGLEKRRIRVQARLSEDAEREDVDG
jgi:hypothetical protein